MSCGMVCSGPCLAFGILQELSLVALGIVTSRKCKGIFFSMVEERKEISSDSL